MYPHAKNIINCLHACLFFAQAEDDSTNLVTRQTEYQAISGPSANIENSEADESHQNGIIDAKASRNSEVHEAGNGLEIQQVENRVVIEETNKRFQLFTIRAATNELM